MGATSGALVAIAPNLDFQNNRGFTTTPFPPRQIRPNIVYFGRIRTPRGVAGSPSMKLSPVLALTLALSASQAQAQNANPSAEARPTNVTANFQMRMSVDPSAPTTEVTKAL